MGRSQNCRSCSKDDDHEGLNRGAWTAEEDMILSEFIKIHGVGRWRSLPKKAGLKRCGKSCRLRWSNYLRPDIKHGNISPEEEELLIRLHRLLGNRWSLIAGRLPGRTDNEIKNYWNTHLRKKHEINECEPKIQKSIKSWDMPSYSDYKVQKVEDKNDYFSQTTPLKTRAVRYSSGVIADVNNYNNNNYDLIQDTGEKSLKAADDHALQIDTSKSWCQLLLEDCIGAERLEMIDGLEVNSIVRTVQSFGIEHHLHSQIPYPTANDETQSSYCCSFDCQEFPHSKQFHSTIESFLDLSELPSVLP